MFEPGLEATAFYDPPDVNFAFGANAAVVEVDTETGKVKILDFVSVDDYGVGINPGIVDGQIHGGIAQGIGQALYEQVSHDESGQVPSASFAAYLLPSAVEMPRLTLDNIVTPSDTPLGVRGVGESGTLASPPAIANAVADALAPFGVRIETDPAAPRRGVGALAPRIDTTATGPTECPTLELRADSVARSRKYPRVRGD